MNLIHKIERYFIKRNLQRRMIEDKVMVETRKDGIWIRLAGGGENMINQDHFVKVVDFRDGKLEKLGIR
jgi:hypothetical protein